MQLSLYGSASMPSGGEGATWPVGTAISVDMIKFSLWHMILCLILLQCCMYDANTFLVLYNITTEALTCFSERGRARNNWRREVEAERAKAGCR